MFLMNVKLFGSGAYLKYTEYLMQQKYCHAGTTAFNLKRRYSIFEVYKLEVIVTWTELDMIKLPMRYH